MKLVYNSLKLKGPKRIFSRKNFFSSKIVFNDNHFFDINNDEVKYAIFRGVIEDENNNTQENSETNITKEKENYFYLKQSSLESVDFSKSLDISGLNTKKISFSADNNVGSLNIKSSALRSEISDLLKTDNTASYIYISNEAEFSTFIACDSTDSFKPGSAETTSKPFMSINSESTNLDSIADTLDLTNTIPYYDSSDSTIKEGYKYKENSNNLMGYNVNGKIISDSDSISKIIYTENNYILNIKSGKLSESTESNILKLTPGSKVYYKEYNSTTNFPTGVTNPTGIYIVREGDKFTIYTPELKEAELI